MGRKYTKREKEELIARYKSHLKHRTALLESQRQKLPLELEAKLKRRLDRVLRKLWDVKMKDVITLEREQKVQMLTLFKDLAEIQKVRLEQAQSVEPTEPNNA